MTKLPVVRPRQLLRALERAGFYVDHVRGSHHYLKHPAKPGTLVVVPMHNRDLKRGTLSAILSQAGLSAADLLNLL